MERHLRLAEARGSLIAPNSPVQDLALEILMVLREAKEHSRLMDDIRVAALSNSIPKERLTAVFPEIWPPDPFEDAKREDGTYDIDAINDESVEWAVPSDLSTDEEISNWINERESGSITGADLMTDWR